MTFEESNYLVSIDCYSSFIEVDPLPDTTPMSVISKLKTQFARHGISQVLVINRQRSTVFG